MATTNETNVGAGAVEVLFTWRDASGQRSVLDAELVDGERCPALWVGSGQSLRFMVPSELEDALGGERFCLVRRDGERFVLRIPRGADVVATVRGELVEAALGLDGVRTLELGSEHVAEVRLGDFAFYVRPGAAPEKVADRGPLLDWRAARWGLAAFAAHAVFVGSFFLLPPAASALTLDMTDADRRYVQVRLDAIARERELEEPSVGASAGSAGQHASTPDEAASGGDQTPEVHVSGGRGSRTGSAVEGPAAPLTATSVSHLGTFASLASAFATVSGDASVFGNPDALVTGTGPGFEALRGGPGVGGFGGLRMTAGHGTCTGEHCGDGTVAVGELGTHGDVGPGGVGGTVAFSGRRPGHVPPRIEPGNASTLGSLSREDIRRTVRRHLNEVRFCYEQGLMSRPDLEGRVSVRFLVDPSGTVTTAAVADTSGSVGNVPACVADSVRRWSFPSAAGMTSVTYPFVLQTAE